MYVKGYVIHVFMSVSIDVEHFWYGVKKAHLGDHFWGDAAT